MPNPLAMTTAQYLDEFAFISTTCYIRTSAQSSHYNYSKFC
jgi:hypothetical protein